MKQFKTLKTKTVPKIARSFIGEVTPDAFFLPGVNFAFVIDSDDPVSSRL